MQSNYRILLGVIITFRDGESKSPRIPGWRDKLNGFCAPGNGWADSGYQLSTQASWLLWESWELSDTTRAARWKKRTEPLQAVPHERICLVRRSVLWRRRGLCHRNGAAGGEGGISMKRDEAIRQPKWSFRPRLLGSASNCWLAGLEPARRLLDNYVNSLIASVASLPDNLNNRFKTLFRIIIHEMYPTKTPRRS